LSRFAGDHARADRGEEPLRSGGREGGQVLRVVGGHEERVRDALWCEDEVAGRRLNPPIADEEGDLARDHVERLVLAAVEVRGWSAAATVPAEELEQAPVRLLGRDLARVPAGVWLI